METLVKAINRQPTEIRELIAKFHREEWVEDYLKRRSILRKRAVLASFAPNEFGFQYDFCVKLPLKCYIEDVYPGESNTHLIYIRAYNDMTAYYNSKGDRKGMERLERLERVKSISKRFFYSVYDECFSTGVADWDTLTRGEKTDYCWRNNQFVSVSLFNKVLESHFLKFDPTKNGY